MRKKPLALQLALLGICLGIYCMGATVVGFYPSVVGLAILFGLRKAFDNGLWLVPFIIIGVLVIPQASIFLVKIEAEIAVGRDVIVNIPKIIVPIINLVDPAKAQEILHNQSNVKQQTHSYDAIMELTLFITRPLIYITPFITPLFTSAVIWRWFLKKRVLATIPELNLP